MEKIIMYGLMPLFLLCNSDVFCVAEFGLTNFPQNNLFPPLNTGIGMGLNGFNNGLAQNNPFNQVNNLGKQFTDSFHGAMNSVMQAMNGPNKGFNQGFGNQNVGLQGGLGNPGAAFNGFGVNPGLLNPQSNRFVQPLRNAASVPQTDDANRNLLASRQQGGNSNGGALSHGPNFNGQAPGANPNLMNHPATGTSLGFKNGQQFQNPQAALGVNSLNQFANVNTPNNNANIQRPQANNAQPAANFANNFLNPFLPQSNMFGVKTNPSSNAVQNQFATSMNRAYNDAFNSFNQGFSNSLNNINRPIGSNLQNEFKFGQAMATSQIPGIRHNPNVGVNGGQIFGAAVATGGHLLPSMINNNPGLNGLRPQFPNAGNILGGIGANVRPIVPQLPQNNLNGAQPGQLLNNGHLISGNQQINKVNPSLPVGPPVSSCILPTIPQPFVPIPTIAPNVGISLNKNLIPVSTSVTTIAPSSVHISPETNGTLTVPVLNLTVPGNSTHDSVGSIQSLLKNQSDKAALISDNGTALRTYLVKMNSTDDVLNQWDSMIKDKGENGRLNLTSFAKNDPFCVCNDIVACNCCITLDLAVVKKQVCLEATLPKSGNGTKLYVVIDKDRQGITQSNGDEEKVKFDLDGVANGELQIYRREGSTKHETLKEFCGAASLQILGVMFPALPLGCFSTGNNTINFVSP